MKAENIALPFSHEPTQPDIRWFCVGGCVTHYPDRREVHIAGVLIGTWRPGEHGMRNTLLVQLASDTQIGYKRLSQAFGVSRETLRLIRRQAREEGMLAVWTRSHGGSCPKVSPALRKKLVGLFEQGVTARKAHKRIAKQHKISYTTIWRVHKAWLAQRQIEKSSTVRDWANEPGANNPAQRSFAVMDGNHDGIQEKADKESGHIEVIGKAAVVNGSATQAPCKLATTHTVAVTKPEIIHISETEALITRPILNVCKELANNIDGQANIAASEVKAGRSIQHIGTWLILAMVMRLGLHAIAARLWSKREGQETLRIALDAVIMALALGQHSVEGVRRLATPTAPVLLRTDHAPSASWVRRLLHRLADVSGSVRFHLTMAFSLLDRAGSEESRPIVFYIDNHLRPYTGKQTVRRGWRMQDKRVCPGTTDYYVHDEDGRPVLRIDVPSHGSLTTWLTPLARLLRERLGTDEQILLAFDRAGAFPEQMASFREDGFEFVTYERRPFAQLPQSAFDREMTINDETLGVHEKRRKNLGKKRGRVRRIAIRTEEGYQVNLLAISEQSAGFLISVMKEDGGRWRQENAFKYGVERWGFNQLDGRKVIPYSPETVIPNPARRRLDRALRIARADEGAARRNIARYPQVHHRRVAADQDLERSMALQTELEAQRPHIPTYAPLLETELAGKLVKHDSHYKTIIDTIRIACVNAESELACALTPHLKKPAEAKKLLSNLYAAPGSVTIGEKTIHVALRPAGTASEISAFTNFFATINRWELTLPGDSLHRRLRFRVQT